MPRQADGSDRYYTVAYDKGRIFSYEMAFAPAVPRSIALTVIRRDVPPDAKLVLDKRAATCEFVTWKSSMLKKATGSSLMTIEMSRTALGGKYNGIVGDVLVASYYGPSAGC